MPQQIQSEQLTRALRFPYREFDRYLNQLLAMQSLARSGEFELAVIGCVTAIEWFLNTLSVSKEKKVLGSKG